MNRHYISIDQGELNKFFRQLNRFNEEKKAAVKKEVARATFSIDSNAKKMAPVKTGNLRSQISPEIIAGGVSGKVTAKARYSAYREFGTGSFVIVPSGYKKYAIQFKGQGKRKVNSKADPYLIPAVEIERDRFISNLKIIFQK